MTGHRQVQGRDHRPDRGRTAARRRWSAASGFLRPPKRGGCNAHPTKQSTCQNAEGSRTDDFKECLPSALSHHGTICRTMGVP
ncbi:hypothetical protein [Azospirillum palustre]